MDLNGKEPAVIAARELLRTQEKFAAERYAQATKDALYAEHRRDAEAAYSENLQELAENWLRLASIEQGLTFYPAPKSSSGTPPGPKLGNTAPNKIGA